MKTNDQITIRQLSDTDSLEDLTELLHRAYKILADMGLKYVATYQSIEITRKRLKNGTCFVAELDGQIAGTVLYRKPGQPKGCAFYERPDVAHVSQMGVEPDLQRRGIGAKLMRHAEESAVRDGASELALDTSEQATHLIKWYERMGFRFVGHIDWEITNYRSVIMSKMLQPAFPS
ncbi:MAG: GNAT family N-acetyltransferase [candidate division Zixibacteria bacterium]|nr:GNAT family N-acetyltransferase [candidate division Zixibacteria bacterium]